MLKRLTEALLFCLVAVSAHADFDNKNLLLPTAPIERTSLKQKKSPLWMENYTDALAQAQQSGKSLLLAFMGAGWCPWSEKFEREILNEGEFLETLKDEVYFVWIACPQEPGRTDPQTQALKTQYGIEEYPTLLLVKPSEEEMFRVGYLPLSPKDFAYRLDRMLQDYREIWGTLESKEATVLAFEQLQDLYLKARDLKTEKFQEAIMAMGLEKDKGTYFLLEKYKDLTALGKKKEAEPVREKIVGRDPKNLKGAQRALAILDFQRRAASFKKKDNLKSVLKPLLEYLRAFGEKDKENRWKIEMMVVQYLFTKNAIEEALAFAQDSLKTAPDASKAQIAETINYLKTYKK